MARPTTTATTHANGVATLPAPTIVRNPGIPLDQYTRAHLEHEYHTHKVRAPRCTVSCVQQVAMIDNWRDPQTRKAFKPLESLVQLQSSAAPR